MHRRTRIVATLGPATDRPGVLEGLLQGGLDVARVNFSHGTAAEHAMRIGRLRELAARLSRPVAVLADLPGPKLRVVMDEPLALNAGQEVTVARTVEADADIRITEPEALQHLKAGQRVLFDDGRLQLRVAGLQSTTANLHVDIGGTLLPGKGMNLPDTKLTLPAVTERDRAALAVAAAAEVDWLALSFVREASAAQELRQAARAHGLRLPVLAKMERPEGVGNAVDIVEAFDGVMVARGDLGVELPVEAVPPIQKRLINLARERGKPVITATDMLDSMRQNPRPTRAEASDVANAVYDGSDAVMLSGETSVGQYPLEALRTMAAIIREAEAQMGVDTGADIPLLERTLMDRVTAATCALARDLQADAIIAPAYSGRTVRLLARHRPRAAIIVPVIHEPVYRQLALVWGLRPILYTPGAHRGLDRLDEAVRVAHAAGAVQEGNCVVVIAGHVNEGADRYPTMRIVRVGPDGRSSEP